MVYSWRIMFDWYSCSLMWLRILVWFSSMLIHFIVFILVKQVSCMVSASLSLSTLFILFCTTNNKKDNLFAIRLWLLQNSINNEFWNRLRFQFYYAHWMVNIVRNNLLYKLFNLKSNFCYTLKSIWFFQI